MDLTVVGVYEYQLSSMMSAMVNMSGEDWNGEIYMPYTTYNRNLDYDEDTFYYFNLNTKQALMQRHSATRCRALSTIPITVTMIP